MIYLNENKFKKMGLPESLHLMALLKNIYLFISNI